MASKRQKKKQAKRRLTREITKGLESIQSLGANEEVTEKIGKIQEQVSRGHLPDLESARDAVNSLQDQNLIKSPIKRLTYRELAEAAERAHAVGAKGYNNAELWAAIKRYNEMVNSGEIPMGSIIDKYDAAEFLWEVLEEEALSAMVDEALEKEEHLWRKNEESSNRVHEFTTEGLDFNLSDLD